MNGANIKATNLVRGKSKGQALPIIALSMLVLVAIVGLAVDGGSAYGQRRKAQNAADGVALAGTREMLRHYQQMIIDYRFDVDGTAAKEDLVKEMIDDYAAKNGITVNDGNLKAYFVNDQKQIVTAALGVNGCGLLNPCTVGNNNKIPWVRGAKGIMITTRSQTDSFFMSALGFNEVGAAANATAYMGIAVDSFNGHLPIGFFTDTISLERLEVGETYQLIGGSTSQGSGNWGFVDFNGAGNPTGVVNAWIACGFNPGATTAEEWAEWCPDPDHQGSGQAKGPTQYWTGMNEPLTGPLYAEAVRWPADPNGWWVAGSSGTTNSTCQMFEDLLPRLINHKFLVPVFDRTNGQGGNGTKFHLIGSAWFRITSATIYCRPQRGEEQHWEILGEFIQVLSPENSGRHGDVRHTSHPVVFLEP